MWSTRPWIALWCAWISLGRLVGPTTLPMPHAAELQLLGRAAGICTRDFLTPSAVGAVAAGDKQAAHVTFRPLPTPPPWRPVALRYLESGCRDGCSIFTPRCAAGPWRPRPVVPPHTSVVGATARAEAGHLDRTEQSSK
jgi:hypothetical protein